MLRLVLLGALSLGLGGCGVTAVVGVAASVVGAGVDIAGSAVSATIDVVGSGVSGAINLATSDDDDDDKEAGEAITAAKRILADTEPAQTTIVVMPPERPVSAVKDKPVDTVWDFGG